MINLFLPMPRAKAAGDVHDDFWFTDLSSGYTVPGGRVSAGVRVSEDTALTYSAVWACTRALSISACLPLEVFRGDRDGVREEMTTHRIAKMWNRRPNPRMTAPAFRSLMRRWQINAGNAFADLSTAGEMWPIHPSRVEMRNDDGPLRLRDTPQDFFYRVHNDDGSAVDFEPEELLHVPSIMTEDGLWGKGIIRHARESVGFGIATERYGANWFGEGGVPRVVVKHPGKMPDDVRRQAREEWRQIHGHARGDKVAFLGGGADVHTLSISAEDQQYLETRQHNVEEISRWYGVPPHMIGHLLRATFSNIEHQGIEFARYSLRPWDRATEAEIERKQLTEREQRDHIVEHDAADLMRGDSQAFAAYLVQLRDSGIIGRNEARAELRFPPADEATDDFTMRGATPSGDGGGEMEEDEPEEEDEPDSTAMAWLEDTLHRLTTRDTKAARTAAGKPGTFIAWLDEWCEPARLVKHLSPLSRVVDVEYVATAWAAQTWEELLAAAGDATARELPGKVQSVTANWADRARTFVEEHGDAAFRD